MRRLEVRLRGTVVGHLDETRKGSRFAYTSEIAKRYAGLPLLSLSFPVKARPFGESKTANWFEGLLPEGERRDAVCRRLGISSYDWMGLLAEIGWECAGAVQVLPEGFAANHADAYTEIGEPELVEKLSTAAAHLPHAGSESFRMSLGGFQDKVCVAMPPLGDSPFAPASGIALPQDDAPSTHILKPESPDYPGAAAAEAWAMLAASQSARCSKVSLLRIAGAPSTVVVERYDREGSYPGSIKRLHQEDACQALGISPSRKYASYPDEKGDDPTYQAIAGMLSRYAEDPAGEMRELFRQMTTNFAFGNWDAHAKNISLVYGGQSTPRVSPLYDVLPIDAIEPRTKLLSLRIDGELDPLNVTGKSLIAEGTKWGLGSEELEAELDECLAGVRSGLRLAAKAYPEAASLYEQRVAERVQSLKL